MHPNHPVRRAARAADVLKAAYEEARTSSIAASAAAIVVIKSQAAVIELALKPS